MKRFLLLLPLLAFSLPASAALLDVIAKGTTDYSVTIRIVDSTDGTPETGVVFNTSGIDLWYRRPGAAHTSITEATQTESGAHSDGGFVHISDGEYRLDLPDAAAASGVNYFDVGGTVTGMVVIGGRVRLTDVDLDDGVRAGLTALPNAAADAAGGLPISDAGGLDLDGLDTDVDSILTDTGTTLDGIVDAILVDTGTTIPGTITTIDNEIAVIDGIVDNILVDTGTTLDAALAVVDGNVDSILVDTGTTLDGAITTIDSNVDAILVDTGTTIPGTITTIDNEIAVIDANVDNLVLEQHVTTIATLASQTSFTLTAGSADADAYNGWEAIVIDSATSTQVAVGIVQDYAVTTRTVTLMVDPGVFTMAVGDTVVLRPANANVRMTNCYEQAGDGTTGTEWSGTGDGGCS